MSKPPPTPLVSTHDINSFFIFYNPIKNRTGDATFYNVSETEGRAEEKTPISIGVRNHLKHLFCQSHFEAPLSLHESLKPMEEMLLPTHSVMDTFHISKIKNDCRVQWYLTITKTAHASQQCGNRRCHICNEEAKTTDLSDGDIETSVSGNVCLISEKTRPGYLFAKNLF